MNIIPIILLVIGISKLVSANALDLCSDDEGIISVDKHNGKNLISTNCSTGFHALVVVVIQPVSCACTNSNQCKCNIIVHIDTNQPDLSVCDDGLPKCYIIKNKEVEIHNFPECQQNETIVLEFSEIGLKFDCNVGNISSVKFNYTHIHIPPVTTVSPTTTQEISGETSTTTTGSSTNRPATTQNTTWETEESMTTATTSSTTITTTSEVRSSSSSTSKTTTRPTQNLTETTSEKSEAENSTVQQSKYQQSTTIGISVSLGILLFIASVVGTVFLIRYRRRQASLNKPMPSTGRSDSYNAGDEMPMNQVYETILDNKTEREEVTNQLYGTR